MKKCFGIVTIVMASALWAEVLITPHEAMKQTFGEGVSIAKKSLLLSRDQAAAVTEKAKMKLSTKIYRAFALREGDTLRGYALLMNEKVRSKNAAVLYMIDTKGALKAIEIVAFNEPPEYIPSQTWLDQFKNKDAAQQLRVGKDIPTITGATMSARNIADGSRVALAIYETVLKP